MLDTLPIPDQIPKVEQLIIKQIFGDTGEYTTELLRLFTLFHHDKQHLDKMGIGKEEMAAYLVSRLPRQGGALFVADFGRRLAGLMYLEPDLEESALLGQHIWDIKHLVLSPQAQSDMVEALFETAVGFLGGPVDFVKASLPASDIQAIRGLKSAGFSVVGGEILGVVDPKKAAVHQLRGMSLVPLMPAHVASAAGVIRACEKCGCRLHDACFEEGRVLSLYQHRLNACLNDRTCGTLVTQEPRGGVLGLVMYRHDTEIENAFHRRLAFIDLACTLPDSNGVRHTELLHRHALAVLRESGVELVGTRTPTSCENTLPELNTLKNIGYLITQTNLVLHHRPQRGAKRITA